MPQDAECFICKSSIEGTGIVRGCACPGAIGLAHVSCLARQAEMAVKQLEDLHQGKGIAKFSKCFDCGQFFHGPLFLALGWAAWKTYLGRPETDVIRYGSLDMLGGALQKSRPEEALPLLQAALALNRRYFSSHDALAYGTEKKLCVCLDALERGDESHIIKREIYDRRVATLGVSDERTITSAMHVSASSVSLLRWDECKTFTRNQLPTARRSLGADHENTLKLKALLASSLCLDPENTRNDLRLNQYGRWQPVFDLDTGDDILEAQTILQDVVQRQRRIFGQGHYAEDLLSEVRARLAEGV